MKNNNTFGQNSIAYIVYHNTEDAAKLLHTYGFEPPKDQHHLVDAIKELARKKGRKVIKDLLRIHPDKQAILKINKPKEDGYCGSCSNNSYNDEGNFCTSCGHSNYAGSGDEDSFLDQFGTYKDKELEKYYQGIVRRSNLDPNNKNLAQEVQMVWNELRKRKETSKKEETTSQEKPKQFSMTRDELILFGVVFIAGTLVGHGLKFNFNNGK